MPIPANANTVIVQGYWWDEQTGGGVNASLTFSPIPLSGSAPTPNLTDLVSYGWIKTRVFTVQPDPVSGYYAVALIANDDPDLTAFGGWKVQPDGEDPFTITVPYNTSTKTITAQMAAAVPGLTQGQTVQALWMTESAVITTTPPVPPSSYLTATQTASAIATALAGVSSGGGSLNPTQVYTSNSHVPVSGEMARYAPTSSMSVALPAAAASQRFGVANVLATSSSFTATFTCAGSDTFSDGSLSLVLAPGERAVLIGASGGFTIESRTVLSGGSAFSQTTTRTANYTAVDNQIVPVNTSGGTFTVTGPSSGKPFGVRWIYGTAAPTVAAPAGYTINGAASITMSLAPSATAGELVTWQAFGTDYQSSGGFKPQSALDQRVADRDSAQRLSPASQITFTQVGSSTVIPLSVGVDGYVYGFASDTDRQLVRSLDGFTTVDNGANLTTAGMAGGVVWAGKLTERYAAVSTTGEVWTSASWTTSWSKAATLGPVQPLSIGAPVYDPAIPGTVWPIGNYSETAGDNTNALWVSTDGGQTWTSRHNFQAVDATKNNHYHQPAYDLATRRLWAVHGDLANAWLGYSTDLGVTWTAIPAKGITTTSGGGALYQQPTAIIPTSRFLLHTPENGKSGFWAQDKSTDYLVPAYEGVTQEGYKQYGQPPFAQNGDRVYALFPMSGNYPESNVAYIAATADGGRSFHKLWQVASTSTDDYKRGLVGPDRQGRLYLRRKVGGVSQLFVGQEPTWVPRQVAASATAAGSALLDLVNALVVAGLLPDGAVNLNLKGGVLAALSAALTGGLTVGGDLSMRKTTGQLDAYFDTAAGNARQLHFQSAGVDRWVLRVDNTAESGSNAGSDLVLVARADDGSALRNVLQINRRFGYLVLADATDINVGTGNGTKIGASATQKLGFFGATPVVKPTALTAADSSAVDATYGTEEATVIGNLRTRVGELETKLKALGLLT